VSRVNGMEILFKHWSLEYYGTSVGIIMLGILDGVNAWGLNYELFELEARGFLRV
jgi:hypothetical protein